MSKISLAPDASGTGIFTIASPNSNTNRTLTLPDDTGTIVTNSGNQAGSFTTLNTSGAVVFNDAGADVDFRVEGDTDANLLFVDASTDRVGIGTGTPGHKVDIVGPDSAITTKIANTSGANYLQITNGTGNGYFGVTGANTVSMLSIGTEPLTFGVDGGTERMRIDSSGNVGIGTSTITSGGGWTPKLVLAASGGSPAWIIKGANSQELSIGASNSMYIDCSGNTTGTNNNIIFRNTSTNSSFSVTERMRIDTSGNLLVGTTSQVGKVTLSQSANALGGYFECTNASFTSDVMNFNATRNTTNGTYHFLRCSISGVAVKLQIADSGNVTNTNNSYGAISDIKLKQDIVDAGSQWDDIKGLRVRKFHWKSDPDGFLQVGLIAQEAELVSPGLIDEYPDYEDIEVPVLDDEGNPVLNEDGTPQVTKERNALGTTTKAVKYSVLYMKAVKALQEAMERIEALEASNTALEARIAALETGA